MSFDVVKKMLKNELEVLDTIIYNELYSDVNLIKNISDYIVSYGGKRIRPILTILMSKALGYSGKNHIVLSAVIELIHTATLLHDDVVDNSDKRRGRLTVNKKWGNREAILVGDFLYTRAFQVMLNIKNFSVLDVIANTTNKLSEGEVIQLVNKNNLFLDEKSYLEIIERKTAVLFSAATEIAAIISSVSDNDKISISSFGLQLGIAYQLIDDILDYNNYDKDVGNDFYEGIYTLPLIYLMKKSNEKEKKYISSLLSNYDSESFLKLRSLILNSGSIDYVFNIAKQKIEKATSLISHLFSNDYKNIIIDLSNFVLNRKF